MDKIHKEIRQGIKAVAHKEATIVNGTVQAFDENAGTMDVVLSADADTGTVTEGQPLTVVSGNMNGMVLIPAVGSYVVAVKVDGNAQFVLVKASDLQKVIVTIGNTKLTMTADGYQLTRGSESLTSLFKDFLNGVMASTFTNGGGTTNPINNLTTFQNILSRVDNLLI